MEVHIYSVKAKSQSGNIMSQRYNDNTERPKLKENQLRILKVYGFCQKVQQRASGPGDSAVGVTYLSMRMHLKSYHIFPLKVAATLPSGSWKGAVRA